MSSFKIPTYIFSSIVLCLTTFSYHSAVANQNVIIDLNKPISAALLAQYNRDGIEIDYDDTTVLKHVYVTAKDGAIARQLPSGAARKVKIYTFGEKLEVIEDRKDWYAVQDRIYREYDEDNDGVVETSIVKWEKVYVKKVQTGPINTIALTAEDLNMISYLSVAGDSAYFEDGEALNDYLQFELIDKALFERKRPLAVNFLSTDKTIKKKNGVLSIQLAKDSVKFVDSDIEGDTEDYRYLGKFDFLDQHLIEVQYWEGHGYKMVDAIEGHLKQEFSDYPYISPNKQYIIYAYANPYELNTDLELYKIEGNDITPIILAGFKNWMPSTEKEDIFWARDGYLYLAVNHIATYWTADGNINDQFQYIRIKVNL